MKATEKTSIKKWYTKEYPYDDLGYKLNPKATFDDLEYALQYGECIYELTNVIDGKVQTTIMRELIFQKLADITEMPYEYYCEQYTIY